MRWTISILTFVLTFLMGAGVVQLHTYFTEWRSPAFSQTEATAMVGHRVRNLFWSDRFRGMKCPQHGGLCADVRVGDEGTVIGTTESSGGYFLVIRWDQPSQGEPMLSYFGRMTRRVFLRIE
jgi:hypothetical protein